MSENNLLEMNLDEDQLGKVQIAPEVIEVIAGIAASEVEGIAEMRGNFAADVAERFGKKNHRKGVKVDVSDDCCCHVESSYCCFRSFLMFESTPFTNFGALSSPNNLASSMASFIETLTGISS